MGVKGGGKTASRRSIPQALIEKIVGLVHVLNVLNLFDDLHRRLRDATAKAGFRPIGADLLGNFARTDAFPQCDVLTSCSYSFMYGLWLCNTGRRG